MENMIRRFGIVTAVGGAFIWMTGTPVFALGFKNPDQDARATAQGEAFVAQADTAAAIYYNPAGLTQLRGTELRSGAYLTFRDIRFNGASGNAGLNDPAYTGHAYLASDLGQEHWRFGFGVNMPFGNSVDWGDNGPFRYVVTESSLLILNFQPTVAYKVNEHLSVGAGFNYYHGNTELNRFVPFSIIFFPLPVADGRFRFDGEGDAFGGTAGLLYKFNEHHSVGVVYRSPFSVDFRGHAVVKNDPTLTFGRSPATAEIDFPQSVAVGYAFRPNQKLKLEVDVEWTDWDTLNTVNLHSPNPNFDAASNPAGATIPFKWESSFYYEAGAQYALNDRWTARAGYIFSENTVPNSTFAPTLPDSNRHVLSAGLGYSSKRVDVDLVYQYSLSEDRTIRNSGDSNFDGVNDLDGKWKSEAHAIMVTSTLKF